MQRESLCASNRGILGKLLIIHLFFFTERVKSYVISVTSERIVSPHTFMELPMYIDQNHEIGFFKRGG